jgi:hypothetical protein
VPTAADPGPASADPLRARRRERALIAALAGFAALRVALFAAAYPFFTNVDEHRHVDLVWKYAHAAVPRSGTASYEPELAELVARLGAPDYQMPAGAVRHSEPGWKLAPDELARRVEANQRLFARMANLDALESPAYYAFTGAWLALLRAVGVGDARAVYSVRLWNALFAAGLVVCAAALLRVTHRDDPLLRWGVPALLACFPTDVFYYVTPDALSPLLGALAFALWLRLLLAPQQGARHYALAGAAAALACLTKLTNVFLPALAALETLRRPQRWRALTARRVAYAAACGVPLAAWWLRNLWLAGDALGSAAKVEALGWQRNPVSAWLAHPLFTPGGFVRFTLDLIPHFWRGELVWRRRELAWPPADALYTATTLVFVALAVATLWRRAPAAQRVAERASAAALALAVATLVVLSLAFVFPEHGNPSAARPWFHHGRLIGAALLPFAILYLRGLSVLLLPLSARARHAAGFALLALLCGLCLGSELWLARPVFASPHNLLHLR